MTSYAERRRLRRTASRRLTWHQRLNNALTRLEVRFSRPTRRELAIAGGLAVLVVGTGLSAPISFPAPATTHAADTEVPTEVPASAPVAAGLAEIWKGTPTTYQLRPPQPGQALTSVEFLADGRLAMRVQTIDGYEEWIQDVPTGARSRVGACPVPCALEPDGTLLQISGDFPNGEKVIDLSVSPSGKHGLVVTTGLIGGYTRTRFRWIDESGMGEPQDLGNLAIGGSIVWRPDEQAAALITHSVASASIMEVGAREEDALYIGDVSVDGTAGQPVAPMSWSPDLSRRVFGGVQGKSADNPMNALVLLTPASQSVFGLMITDGGGLPGVPFGQGGMSPMWLPDGRLLAVGNTGNDLVLRLIDTDGTVTPLAKLGIQVTSPTMYAARWDLVHHRILVVLDRTDVIGTRDVYVVSYG